MRLLRFTLLMVLLVAGAWPSAVARAVPCPHAPAPRLRAGETAVIANGINRLNLRSLPAVDTGIETLLAAGIRLTILSGPSCNGNYNWWRVEMENGVRGWVAEGDWQNYFVVPAHEQARPIDPYEWTCLPARLLRRCFTL